MIMSEEEKIWKKIKNLENRIKELEGQIKNKVERELIFGNGGAGMMNE